MFHNDKNNLKGKRKAYYCKECANSKGRKWHKNNGDSESVKRKKRDRYFLRNYNITVNEYEELLAKQNYECQICKVKLLSYGNGTHLDHCHTSGKIRAILCTNCNRGLGHFQDNVEFLKRAVDYLQQHTLNED